MLTTARKVFGTPELLSLICDHSTRASCTRILRVDKAGFFTAVPFVWRDVQDVINLLALFPSVILSFSASRTQTVTFPPITALDFSRFKLYAPYVKSVKVYPKQFFVISNWNVLNSALDQRPFLPKLQSLFIHTSWDVSRPSPLHCAGWINWFMSPSLTEIRLVHSTEIDPDGLMSLWEVSAILQAITEGRPQLKRLTLPPCDSRVDNIRSEDTGLFLGLLRTRPFEQYLSQLHALCELEGSMLLLKSALIQTVGSLPHLKSLKLHRSCWESIPTDMTFSPGAFPALESLALINFYETEVAAALDLIPVLSQLTRLELEVNVETEGNWLVTALFPRLERMTRLSVLHLTLELNFLSISRDYHNISNPAAMRVFSKLPLEEVKLGGLMINDSADLSAMFPSVKRLEIPDAEIHLHMLTPFAAMPKLEQLTTSLILHEDCAPYRHTAPGSPTFRTLKLSIETDIPFNVRLLFQAGQTLLDIWPNIYQIVPASPEPGSDMDQTIESLHTCLSIVRKTRDRRVRMVEKYGWEEAASFFPESFFSAVSKST
ncbi:hypothetical protein FRC08_006162 [Ceratobasidium sp. 394]|nr:hypothetical protein FRC08_006162 [Ceratobasidium sp. 394]